MPRESNPYKRRCPTCGEEYKSQGLGRHTSSGACLATVRKNQPVLFNKLKKYKSLLQQTLKSRRAKRTMQDQPHIETDDTMAIDFPDGNDLDFREGFDDTAGTALPSTPGLVAAGVFANATTDLDEPNNIGTHSTTTEEAAAEGGIETNIGNEIDGTFQQELEPPYVGHSSTLSSRPPLSAPAPVPSARQLLHGRYFEIQHHPRSGLPTQTLSLDEYLDRHTSPNQSSSQPSLSKPPWSPYLTRADFTFSKIVQNAQMSERMIDDLLDFIHSLAKCEDRLTFTKMSDLKSARERAALLLSAFKEEVIEVPFRTATYQLNVSHRSVLDVGLELLRRPELANKWVWNAQKHYLVDGDTREQVIHEPWTGKRMYEIQSRLPEDGVPFGFIVYSDKTLLSPFGKVTGYPMLIKPAQLPVALRNSEGLGGCEVVGWIPSLKDDPLHKGKPAWTNFKRVVWHASFHQVLESIIPYCKSGLWSLCADGVERRLFPFILMYSADYEEQCVIALVRGTKANCPCPICLVKNDEQIKISEAPPKLRNAKKSKRVVQRAFSFGNSSKAESLLKKYGLRGVTNTFWDLAYSDPHHILSFDPLHFLEGGIFSDHLFEDLSEVIKNDDTTTVRNAESIINKNMETLPRWRGLHHFTEFLSIKFADCQKYDHISRMLLFVIHSVLDNNPQHRPYLFMQCVRGYLDVMMHAKFKVQTTSRITSGREYIKSFGQLVQMYANKSDRSWSFPKLHLLVHLFDDVEAKGVTRNYNTKPFEKSHRLLKKAYLLTNFKNTDGQILRRNHAMLITNLISLRIEQYDADAASRATRSSEDGSADDDEIMNSEDKPDEIESHITLCSKQRAIRLSDLLKSRGDDAEFHDFQKRLEKYLLNAIQLLNHPLAGMRSRWGRLILPEDQLITPSYCITAIYESFEDWEQYRDILRCNPSWYGQPRYDHILVNAVSGQFFARLAYVFSISLENGHTYDVALIHPLDASTGRRSRKDHDLSFYRVRQQPLTSCEFIPVESIVRGAYVVPDFGVLGDYLVVDLIDADWYLRLRRMFGH